MRPGTARFRRDPGNPYFIDVIGELDANTIVQDAPYFVAVN